MTIKKNIDAFLHRKREKRRLQRLRELRRDPAKPQMPAGHASGLAAFRRCMTRRRAKGKTKEIILAIPTKFSILDEPEIALDILYSLVEDNDAYKKIKKIFFDHSSLTDYDLAAEKLLDHLAAEVGRERVNKRPKTELAGRFPTDDRASRFIRGIGIIRTLGIDDKYMSPTEKKSLEIFDKMDNNALRVIRKSSETTPRDSAVQRFTEHIDNCLRRNGHRLTKSGRHELGFVSGEVIDNAIQHSEGDGWVIAGYLDTNDPENVCEITVFNFGMSIADTLLALPPDHFTSKIVRPFVDAHVKHGFFGSGWAEEDLLTLVALQENISSKNHSAADTRGGGTVDLIQFFQQVHKECESKCVSKPKMAILSGRTHIVFDGKYQLKPDKSGRPVIAFNNQNRLDLEPDRTYFKQMKKRMFPGTVVCIRFPMPKNQYEKAEETA